MPILHHQNTLMKHAFRLDKYEPAICLCASESKHLGTQKHYFYETLGSNNFALLKRL